MAAVTLLEDLVVSELSLVDAPANLRDGWAAMKARQRTELAVVAKSQEHRIASAVAYEPLPAVDAHGEGIDPVTLTVGFLRYAAKASKTLRLQHQPGTVVGEVIALVAWPAAKSVKLCTPSACASPKLAPFTVYTVTHFTPAGFNAVREGAALGLSLGGSAKRRPGADATPGETPNAGWAWTSDVRIAAVLKAAELPQVNRHPLWEIPRDLDARLMDALWGATLELGFLEVAATEKSKRERRGNDRGEHARARLARGLVGW